MASALICFEFLKLEDFDASSCVWCLNKSQYDGLQKITFLMNSPKPKLRLAQDSLHL